MQREPTLYMKISRKMKFTTTMLDMNMVHEIDLHTLMPPTRQDFPTYEVVIQTTVTRHSMVGCLLTPPTTLIKAIIQVTPYN